MPVHEFFCDTCGPFEHRRDVREASSPMECPTCRATAKRIYSPPGLYKTSRAFRQAMLRDEQGAEPSVVRRTPEEPDLPGIPHNRRDIHHADRAH